ncbi:hypothetical protein D9M68_784960 [compost metagenome]
MAYGVTHHGLGQPHAQGAVIPRAGQHPRLLRSIQVQARRGIDGRGRRIGRGGAEQGVAFAQTAGTPGQQGAGKAALQHIFGHRPVGGPFAARDGDEAIGVHHDGVFARQDLGAAFGGFRGRHQRAQAHPDAADVLLGDRAA